MPGAGPKTISKRGLWGGGVVGVGFRARGSRCGAGENASGLSVLLLYENSSLQF